MKKYMMATKATHLLGNISSDEPDLCRIYREEDDDYIGKWVIGHAFVGIHFPKTTTRELTPKEVKKFNTIHIQMGRNPPIKLKVD